MLCWSPENVKQVSLAQPPGNAGRMQVPAKCVGSDRPLMVMLARKERSRTCGKEHRESAISFWAALLAMICCVCKRPSAALLLLHLTSSFPRAPVSAFCGAWLPACCSAVSKNR